MLKIYNLPKYRNSEVCAG